jgi:hypothetical protein
MAESVRGARSARQVEDIDRVHTTRETQRSGGPDRAAQKEKYGGFHIGSAFFGWLVAVGMGAILTGILSAAGAVIGLTQISGSDAKSNAGTIGIAGGVLLLLVLMLAYYCGGYVAGRMSRFDGARQGFGVWLFGILIVVILGIAAAVLGAEYNVLERINLPSIPVAPASLGTEGLIATIAVVLGTLLAAIFGGKIGQRYHTKVDRAGA